MFLQKKAIFSVQSQSFIFWRQKKISYICILHNLTQTWCYMAGWRVQALPESIINFMPSGFGDVAVNTLLTVMLLTLLFCFIDGLSSLTWMNTGPFSVNVRSYQGCEPVWDSITKKNVSVWCVALSMVLMQLSDKDVLLTLLCANALKRIAFTDKLKNKPDTLSRNQKIIDEQSSRNDDFDGFKCHWICASTCF